MDEFELDYSEAFEGDGSEDVVEVDVVAEFEAALRR